jgi:Glycosyl hydrolase family 99
MNWAAVRLVGLAVAAAATLLAAAGPVPVQSTWAEPARAARAANARAANASAAAIPLFAYYYEWFDPRAWERAKTDYPSIGRYSSDDPRAMRKHIQWAKSAGIDGFIVSWKDTATNNRRLRLLMSVARELHFKLAMIYQGLDFERRPQPVARVAADFVTFGRTFAADPVFFRLAGRPLTIWSGTWSFSSDQIALVTAAARRSLRVLATERSVDGYRRVMDAVDGNAYYWPSVDPESNNYYTQKLVDMSAAVHRTGKYWIAPFAPGFDARLIGGTREVARKDGQTLRLEYAAALTSSPDVLGLISWNEFSENSHIEPSQKYGSRYLDVVRELRTTGAATTAPATGSSGAARSPSPPVWFWPNVFLLVGFPVGLVVVISVIRRRRTR